MVKQIVTRNGSIGYLKGENFFSESNFVITRVVCCVHIGDRHGYLVQIKGTNQENESTCFFTLEDSNTRKHFLKAINSSTGSGGYMCQLHDVPLNKYLMELTDDFKSHSRENAVGKIAATCQGLNGDTWVLNDMVQVDQDGNQLGVESTPYVWLGKYTSISGIVPQKYAANIVTPLKNECLGEVLRSLQQCLGQNFVPAFLYIASGVMLVHYRFCQERLQQCPTPMAVGPKGTGKTTAAKVFLSLTGHGNKNLVRQLSEVECMTQSSMSSFPYVYDDPDNMVSVKALINNLFNGQAKSTTRRILQPKTGCMFTLNTEKLATLLKDFQEASRVVIIPFPRLTVSNPLASQVEYERDLGRRSEAASRSVGVLISVAAKLVSDCYEENLSETIQKVESIIGQGMHHRIVRNYTTLMLFASKISELCPEQSPQAKDIWEFFSEHIRPMIEKYQVERNVLEANAICKISNEKKTRSVLLDFVENLLSPLSGMTSREARKYVTPAVRCQGKLGYAVAKSNIRSILGDKDSFEAAIKAVQDGGLGEDNPVRDFNSANGDGKQKQRALVFRRTAIPSYLRKRLDKVLAYEPTVEEVDEDNETRQEISIICSTDTRWLNKAEVVIALGEERYGCFTVIYPLDNSCRRGDEILLDGEYTTSTFPPGTKVSFTVVQANDKDDQMEDGDQLMDMDHQNDAVSIEEDDDTNNVAEANSTIKKVQLTNKKATQSSIEVSIEEDDDTNNVAEANSTIKKRQLTNKKATQSSIEVSIEEDDDTNNVAEANSTIKKRQLTNKKATQSSIEVSIEEDDDTNNVGEANSTIKKRQLTNKKATQSSSKKKGEVEKLSHGFSWYQNQGTSRKRPVKGTRAAASFTATTTEEKEKQALDEEIGFIADEKESKRRKKFTRVRKDM